MRILHVTHNYPPHYMAGSEVYTYNLSKELAKRNDVTVFCQVKNQNKRHKILHSIEENVSIYRVNNSFVFETFRSRFIDKNIDKVFNKILKMVVPDVVHIGHLNHLSTSIVNIIEKRNIPIVYTLHDFWLLCPRGQFVRKDLTICSSYDLSDCVDCFKKELKREGINGIRERKRKISEIFEIVDFSVAPSKFLMSKYIENGVPEEKLIYSDYGFDLELFNNFIKKTIR